MEKLIIFIIVLALASAAFAPMIKNSKANKPEYIIKHFTVTAYCPCVKCCGRFADGITASGHKIKAGDKFAAAPPEIPFGTILDVPGYGKVPVHDRGGAIRGNRIDVFFSSHQEALRWGVQFLAVKIYESR
jgi:3D (Asp-Asp-Asp) domain-containing protein